MQQKTFLARKNEEKQENAVQRDKKNKKEKDRQIPQNSYAQEVINNIKRER